MRGEQIGNNSEISSTTWWIQLLQFWKFSDDHSIDNKIPNTGSIDCVTTRPADNCLILNFGYGSEVYFLNPQISDIDIQLLVSYRGEYFQGLMSILNLLTVKQNTNNLITLNETIASAQLLELNFDNDDISTFWFDQVLTIIDTILEKISNVEIILDSFLLNKLTHFC